VIIIIEFSVLRRKLKITPTRMIVFGFMILIVIGTLLLNLPVASRNGQPAGFINAVFTATSAVCVNGLAVLDTGNQWTAFGQTLIALLMQIGGLGIMTMSTLLALILGRRITLRERLLIQESLNQFDLEGLVRLTKSIIIAAFAIEFIGAIMYSIEFIPAYGAFKGVLYGIFHSIAALCNSGFDLIGDYRSFTSYTNNFIININTMLLIVIGGLGFSVWTDTLQAVKDRSIRSITLHSKVVLVTTVFLILSGAVFLFILEMGNANTMKHLPFSGKVLASFFHSITSRTAGFSTIDMTGFTSPSKFMLIIMMFIGGSPGSTAGGIKTTTAAILMLTIIAVVKGKEDPVIFERHLPKYLVYRAMAVTAISLGLVVFVTMMLSITENADFLTLFFEATSAFSTTGLTLNFTPKLSPIGKLIISITMFAGRVGPLSLVLAFAQRASSNKGNLKYPEDRIMVG
jgi:trk system potassium uptake protein TrkH